MIMMKMKILVSMMISKLQIQSVENYETVKLKNSFVLTSQYSLLYNHDIL